MDVRILGALEAHDGERTLDLGLRKARILFAALALAPRTPVRSERLAEALWPAGPPPRWESGVHSHVSRLRTALEPDRAARAPSTRLETRGDAYVLHLADDELDARRFERLAADGRAALGRGDYEPAAELFDRALAEWRGPVLADLADAPFVTADANRLDELRLVAREERAEAELALGGHATAVADLEVLVQEHPLRERCWELLLLALYRSGRQAEALRRYQDVRSVLVDELGIEPGPALRELETSILRQDDELLGVALGRGASSEPATVALPTWLRPPNDAFVGRAAEREVIAREWKRALEGTRRLVVVDGEPGIGKTRLVREVCRELAIDGALVVGGRCPEEPLHALEPFAEAVGRFAAADAARLAAVLPNDIAVLGGLIPEFAVHAAPLAAVDAQTQTLLLFRAFSAVLDARNAGRPVVVVLDDLHWAPAATLRLLAYLLRDDDRGPLLVVATARDTEPRPDVDALIADMRREHRMERVALSGLEVEHVNALARARGSTDDPQRLYAMTDGNPFYVEELVRHVAESGGELATDSVPDSVRDTIARRLLRLPGRVRRLLGVGAVAGQEFRLDILAAAGEVTIDEADDALLGAIGGRCRQRESGPCRRLHVLARVDPDGAQGRPRRRAAGARAPADRRCARCRQRRRDRDRIPPPRGGVRRQRSAPRHPIRSPSGTPRGRTIHIRGRDHAVPHRVDASGDRRARGPPRVRAADRTDRRAAVGGSLRRGLGALRAGVGDREHDR